MTTRHRLAGAVVGLAAAWGMAALSDVPIVQPGARIGQLRLTWRARPERVEQCREQDAETLNRLPAHMRQPLICEGVHAWYQLDVWRDDTKVLSKAVHPGGLRQDRPLYVFEQLPVEPGSSHIRVTFTRQGPPSSPGTTASNASTRRQDELTEAVPASLTYDAPLAFAPGQVRVISYDPASQRLYEVLPHD